jgi:hypothetical protein
MKTTYIVLIGVVGVGAVGAYMYMKNKKAQEDLLSGSLPATPSGTPTSGTPPLATTPLIPTPNLTEPVKIIGDANLDAFNLQQTLDQLKKLNDKLREKEPTKMFLGKITQDWKNWDNFRKIGYKSGYKKITDKLAKLGYKYDNGLLIKI